MKELWSLFLTFAKVGVDVYKRQDQTFSPPAGGELCEDFDRPTVCMAFPERSEAFC